MAFRSVIYKERSVADFREKSSMILNIYSEVDQFPPNRLITRSCWLIIRKYSNIKFGYMQFPSDIQNVFPIPMFLLIVMAILALKILTGKSATY